MNIVMPLHDVFDLIVEFLVHISVTFYRRFKNIMVSTIKVGSLKNSINYAFSVELIFLRLYVC